MKAKLLLPLFFFFTYYMLNSQNLVAYYPFNGNGNDNSGYGNHGTVNGATLTTDRFGNVNSAYYFDGINDYIDLGSWENGGAMTFSFWARWDSNHNYSRIIELGNGPSSDNIVVSQRQSNDELFFSIYLGSSETKMFTSTTLSQWNFYSATVNASGVMTLYKNGELIAQKIDGVTPNTILRNKQFIGKSNFAADGYFKGAIDELRIYNKSLTPEEIKNEFKGLVAYYPFNGNANDESGNNHHGTVNGATLTTDRFGNANSAYSFDGNDIISVNHSLNLNINGELSFSVWVKPTSLKNAMILGKSNYVSNTNYLLRTTSTGYIAFEYKNFANSNSLPLTVNVWNHIAVISEADNTKKVYINNVLTSHSTETSPYGLVTDNLTIGARSGAEYFNGAIDDLRIYKSALTALQVSNLFSLNTLKVKKIEDVSNSKFYVHNNILHFKNTQNLSEIKSVEVYNLLGEKVFETSKITTKTYLNLLQKGIYILKVEKDFENYLTLKFLIN